jgi:uncharacterized protein (DUF885 family)
MLISPTPSQGIVLLKRLASLLFVLVVFAPAFLCAQLKSSATAPMTPEDRTRALHALFHDYWEANLKRQPEFASTIGDKRYNDKVSNYSVSAINDWLAAEQDYLMKLATIDPAGLSDQDRVSLELLIRRLTDDQEAAEFKEWEMPVNQMGGIYSTYPQLVAQLSFTTVKDYDDWIARLHKIPGAFDQVTAEMTIGVDDKRVPPKYLLEKTLEQVNQLAGEKPEDSPLAVPLKKFPARSQLRNKPASRQKCWTRSARKSCRPTSDSPVSLRSAIFLREGPSPASQRCPMEQSTTNLSSAAPRRPISPPTRSIRSVSMK